MAINLSVAPYFDDFNENKNYHKIVFKPGSVVQSRELVQLQTITQDQIKKLGRFLLSEGSRLSGAQLVTDVNTIAVKIVYPADLVDDLENFENLFIVGQTSQIVAQIKKVNVNSLKLFVKPITSSLVNSFVDGESLYIFETQQEALNSLQAELFTPSFSCSAANTVSLIVNTVQGNQYTSTLSSSVTQNIEVGDLISSNNFLSVYNVINVQGNVYTLNKQLQQTISLSDQIIVTKNSSKKVLEVGITEGVFFSNGNLVKCNKQSIIPNENTAYPTTTIGLRFNETIRDYVDDSSLLDPALNSTNYSAPGADRYTILLELTAKPLSETNATTDLQADEKFIELARIKRGQIVLENKGNLLGEIKHTLARRMYDHAGHFIINPFKLSFSERELQSNNSTTLTFQISPGKAYFYGYEFETFFPSYVTVNKPIEYLTKANDAISISYGDSIKVSNVVGEIPISNTIQFVGLYNSSNTHSNNLIGIAEVKTLNYSGSNTYDLILNNIKIVSNNATVYDVKAISNTSTTTFKAEAVQINGKTAFTDRQNGSFIFSYNGQIKEQILGSLSVVTKTVSANAYVSNNKIIADAPPKKRYEYTSSNTLPESIVSTVYDIVIKDTNGDFTANTRLKSNQVSVLANSTTSLIELNGKSYTGNVKVTATYRSYSQTPVLKAQTYANSVVTINSCKCACLWYSDINYIIGVWDITGKNYRGLWSEAYVNPFNEGDLVRHYKYDSYDNFFTLYECINPTYAQQVQPHVGYTETTSTYKDKQGKIRTYTNPITVWKLFDSYKGNWEISNGQTNTLYDHGRLYVSDDNAIGNTFYVGLGYFQHSDGDYINYESYISSNTSIINPYTDVSRGVTYNLSNSIDLRPRRLDKIGCECCSCGNLIPEDIITNAKSEIVVPKLDTSSTELTEVKKDIEKLNTLNYSASFYLPRIDVLVLGKNKQFKILEGVASENPKPPKVPSEMLKLATIYYRGGAYSKEDIKIVYDSHKRYTMDAIKILDNRVSRIEYYTSLSLAEQSSLNKSKTDSLLSQRLNSGILADSFENFSLADYQNKEFLAEIDLYDQIAKPKTVNKRIELKYDEENTVATTNKNRLFLLPYITNDSDAVVQQQLDATSKVNVNEFNRFSSIGTMELYPNSDIWFDTVTKPEINIVSAGVNDLTTFNEIQTEQTVLQIYKKSLKNQNPDKITLESSTTSTKLIEELSENVVPYARSIPIQISVSGLVPLLKVYVYVNDILVNNYCYSGISPKGEITKIDVVSGGVGYSSTNTKIDFIGSNTRIATANAIIFKGSIVGIDIDDRGSGYDSNLNLNVTGVGINAKLLAHLNGISGSDFYCNKSGGIELTLMLPNDEFLQFKSGELLITVSDHPTNPNLGRCKASAKFISQGNRWTLTNENTISAIPDNTLGNKDQIRYNTIQNFTEQTLPSPGEIVFTPSYDSNNVYSLISKDINLSNVSAQISTSIYKIFKQNSKTITTKLLTEKVPSSVASIKSNITDVKFNNNAYLTFNSNCEIQLLKENSNTDFYSIVQKTEIYLPDYVIFNTPLKFSIIDSNFNGKITDISYKLSKNNKSLILNTNIKKTTFFAQNVSSTNLYLDSTFGIECSVDTKNLQLYFDGLITNIANSNTQIISLSDNSIDTNTKVNFAVAANNAVSKIESVKPSITNFTLTPNLNSNYTFDEYRLNSYNEMVDSYIRIQLDDPLVSQELFQEFLNYENFFSQQNPSRTLFDSITSKIQNLAKKASISFNLKLYKFYDFVVRVNAEGIMVFDTKKYKQNK